MGASPAGSDAVWSATVGATGSGVVGAAGTAGVLAFFADGFVVAFFADVFVVAFFVDAFVDAAFSVGAGTGAGTASGVPGGSAGTIGSAPMRGVERRLARSPDARAAPAAKVP